MVLANLGRLCDGRPFLHVYAGVCGSDQPWSLVTKCNEVMMCV